MSEDCLYLNIWTPARSTDEKLPVIYYIHGGGFCGGYSYELEFDGEHVARNGVIFVTVGYRLGALGFFAHTDLSKEVPNESQGNFGLLDQLAGIEWLKRNVGAFGGDPDRITIAGQSAGGMSVQSLLTSPRAQNLFCGAIMMSCGGINAKGTGVIIDRPLSTAQSEGAQLLQYLGVKTVEEARRIDAATITATALGMRPDNGQLIMWVPTQDGVLIHETVREAFLAGHTPKIPCMIGACWDESRPSAERRPEFASCHAFTEFVHRTYGDSAPLFLNLANVHSDDELVTLLQSDEAFSTTVATRSFAHRQALDGKDVYVYLFHHDVPGDDRGSYHGSDMWFTFDSLQRCWRPFEGKHYDLARQVSGYWTNFAKFGTPNGTDRLGLALPNWAPYTPSNPFVLCFKDQPERMEPDESPLMKLVKQRCMDCI